MTDEELEKQGFGPSKKPFALRPSPVKAGEGYLRPAAVGRGVGTAINALERAGQTVGTGVEAAKQVGQEIQQGYREARGLPPKVETPASPTATPPVPRANDMVGEYKRELTPGGVRYSGPAGTMEGRGTGSGAFSTVSGPGRGNMSQQQWNALPNEKRIARNVASYESQTQAIRDARNAGRAARGERPVGQRADEEVLVMGEAPKETDQIRTERLLTDMVEEGTPKDRRTAIELLANMNTLARPGKGEAPSFADQLGVARFGLDTAKAEADALQATRQNQIASAREERENMLANLQLNKADKEMMTERVEEIKNSSLGDYGLPAEMLAGMERGLAKQLGNVDDTTIAANLQMELEEMRKNGNLPKKPDLAKLDQAALMKKVYDRIQRAQEKEE